MGYFGIRSVYPQHGINMVSSYSVKSDGDPNSALPVQAPQLGPLPLPRLDAQKQYHAAAYKLSSDCTRNICDALGFNARFDLSGIKAAWLDVWQGTGLVVLDIDRNSKPQDIAVRYSRERWTLQDALSKGPEGLRPLIRSEYFAPDLDQQTGERLAQELRVQPHQLNDLYIRLNIKEATAVLIAEDTSAVPLPDQCTAQFPIPIHAEATRQQEAVSPPTDTVSGAGHPEAAKRLTETIPVTPKTTDSPKREAVMQGEAKYATYSQSEIDHMFKQNAESILNALSAKMSTQQRTFQEAVAAQEKSFGKLNDNFVVTFEANRAKLEATVKTAQDSTHSELEDFHKLLSKELDQHRSQISKTVLPVSKALENKGAIAVKEATKAAPPIKNQAAVTAEMQKLEKLVMLTLVLSLASAVMSAVSLFARVH